MLENASIVFPVRFVAGGQATETTSRELGREEISVRCLQPPLVGTRISMALYLPGSAKPEVVVGEVSESSPGNGRPVDAGFRVRFLALDPEGRHRIDALLEELSRMGPPPRPSPQPEEPEDPSADAESADAESAGAESEQPQPSPRLFPRYPVRFKIRFSDPLEFLTQFADNISRGGLFIDTLDPPELERSVALVLQLPDGGSPISAAALVVHRMTMEEAARDGQTPGCGVQFLDTSDGFHERIDAYLEKLANTPEDPE